MENYFYQNKEENKEENKEKSQRDKILFENQIKIHNIYIKTILNDGRLAGFDKNLRKIYILNKKDFSFDLEIKIPETYFYNFHEIQNNHIIYFASSDDEFYYQYSYNHEYNSTIKIIQLLSQNTYKILNTITLKIPIQDINYEVSSNGIVIIGYKYPIKKYDYHDNFKIRDSSELKYIYCFTFYKYYKETYQVIRKIEYNNIIDIYIPNNSDKIICLNNEQLLIKQYTSLTFIHFQKGNLLHIYKEGNQQINLVQKYSKNTILMDVLKYIDGQGDISYILIYDWKKQIVLKIIKNNFIRIFFCINEMIFASNIENLIKIFSLIDEEFKEIQDLNLNNSNYYYKYLKNYIYIFSYNNKSKETVVYKYKINK